MSQCAWTVLSGHLKQGAAFDDAVPGAVIAVQTFGDFQNFNPHLHIIATDGCFYGNGGFAVGPRPNPSDLETAFRLEVLKMLKNEGPSDQEGIERSAQYIIRAPISQERMTYIPAAQTKDGVAKVVYTAKDGRTSRTFAALDWLAQLVRYYGYCSNKSRGLRKKSAADDQIPALVESGISRTEFRKNWARLIQKVYHADPLLCSKCNGSMRIVSFIESPETIKKILLHLDLIMEPAPVLFLDVANSALSCASHM